MYVILLILTILITIIFIFNYIQKKSHENTFVNITNKKIAFLFLITDIINKEELWHDFFKNVDVNKYSIYIHHKTNDQLKYFNRFKISDNVATQWGDISIVKASQLLLQTALTDTSNYKFIFVSGACIPIKKFDYIYDFLIKDNNSYFNTSTKVERNNTIMYKTFQWCILNMPHAHLIAHDTEEIQKYTNLHAPDELYMLTTLYKKNDENIVINTTVDTYTTHARWKHVTSKRAYEFSNEYRQFDSIVERSWGFPRYPYNYTKMDDVELIYLVNNTSCLFVRKITKKCVLNRHILPY